MFNLLRVTVSLLACAAGREQRGAAQDNNSTMSSSIVRFDILREKDVGSAFRKVGNSASSGQNQA